MDKCWVVPKESPVTLRYLNKLFDGRTLGDGKLCSKPILAIEENDHSKVYEVTDVTISISNNIMFTLRQV